MELNELRIGNWFLGYDNKPFQWDLQCFTYLTPTDIERALELDEIIKEPIPLTEEWLFDFGFDHMGIIFRKSVTHHLELAYMLSINEFRIQTKGNGFTNTLNIKHVHELQNLYYSLTGEELIKK